MKRLREQGFTEGLALSLNELQSNFPLRIWVVDNSGSMGMTDGHRLSLPKVIRNTTFFHVQGGKKLKNALII